MRSEATGWKFGRIGRSAGAPRRGLYFAGPTPGVWKNREEIAAHWAREHSFAPAPPPAAAQTRMAEWPRAVRCALTFSG
jgi:glycerol kinase